MAKKKNAEPKSSFESRSLLRKVDGKSFVFSGRVGTSESHERALKLVLAEGGTVQSEVTADLSFLVVGTSGVTGASAAEKKAQRLNEQGAGITILDADGFFALFAPTRDEVAAMLSGGIESVLHWNEFYGGRESPIPLPDLTGVDLSDRKLGSANCLRLRLDGANLQKSVWGRVEFGTLRGVNLDEASIHEAEAMIECTARRARLSNMRLPGLLVERCDFTDADTTALWWDGARIDGCVFHGADLRVVFFSETTATSCDFSSANLLYANLPRSEWTDTNFTNACLENADFSDARLVRANFTGANLRNANLMGTEFSEAIVDGANFSGAKLAGARLNGVDTSKAIGLTDKSFQMRGAMGPALHELNMISQRASALRIEGFLKLPDGEVRVSVNAKGRRDVLVESCRGGKSRMEWIQGRTTAEILLRLANRFSDGELDLMSVKIKARQSGLNPSALRRLAIAAWCEACGMDRFTDSVWKSVRTSVAADRRAVTTAALAGLRSGPAGIQEWNARPELERGEIGQFQGEDFRGLDLGGVNLGRTNLSGADFTGADLSKGDLWNAKGQGAKFVNAALNDTRLGSAWFQHADFTNAHMHGAWAFSARLQDCILRAADLSSASFEAADLRGADFTGANMADCDVHNAEYDAYTRFPEGFDLYDQMYWKGVGPRPVAGRIVAVTDFDTLILRLQHTFDSERLRKAGRMLKGDRFLLFAEVTAEGVTGVIKSQSDANLVYSCWLSAIGSFACCSQKLRSCGGLRGAPCKHLLGLVIGLAKGGELDPATVDAWLTASQTQKPALDKDRMAETFLKYKGAEAGEIDWRPTETLPEDYYAL